MTRVVHLTSVHPPFDPRIFTKECCSLAEAGYEVVLVAPHERDETRDRVRIHAVTRPKSRRERFLRTIRDVLRAAIEEDADIYHFHDPELIPAGLLLKLRGKRVVYDVHEDLPRQILSKYWLPAWLRIPVSRVVSLIEWLAAHALDAIVTVTPHIAARFPRARTHLVRNFPIPVELANPAALPLKDRPPAVAYVGAISLHRGIGELVTAMDLLPIDLSARLIIAGTFDAESTRETIERMPGWRNVEYLGWQSRAEVAAILGRARAGLVLLHPIVNYQSALPVKLFEYMAAGLPVVASNLAEWRTIVERSQCGVLVNPLDPAAIAKAIHWILQHPDEARAMGERGRMAVRDEYSWETEKRKLLALYERLLGVTVTGRHGDDCPEDHPEPTPRSIDTMR